MREKHPLGRRLLTLTAAICTLGSLAVVPVANAEQAAPAQPEAQQQAPQAGKSDGTQQAEADAQPENADKPADGDTQEQPETNAGSADEAVRGDIPLDEEHFPDAKFREYVRRFDTISSDGSGKPDGYLSQVERDKVTEIDIGIDGGGYVPSYDLKSVQGVGYFRKLKKLVLMLTGVNELDLSGNPELEKLYAIECPFLTKVDISKNVKLRELDVSESDVTSLDLPKGNKQIQIDDVDYGLDGSSGAPWLLAVRGDGFKGSHGSIFYSGRAVIGSSLDLAEATGFERADLEGHILLLPKGDVREEYADDEVRPLKGTVIRSEKDWKYPSYLFFPNTQDVAQWNHKVSDSNVPVMLVHIGFIDSEWYQRFKDQLEVDSRELTPESGRKNDELNKKLVQSMEPPFPQTIQGVEEYYRQVFNVLASSGKVKGYGEADWQKNFSGDADIKPTGDFRVVPVKPSRDGNAVTIPAWSRVVSYRVGDQVYGAGDRIPIPVAGTLKVEANAKEGWTLASAKENGGVAPDTKWEFEWQSQTVAPQKPVQNGDVLTISPVEGVEYFYTYQETDGELLPFGNQTSIRVGGRPVWVVAKPAKGYQFAKDQKTVFGPYSYTAPNPPDNGNNNGNTGNNGGGTTTPSATLVDVERFYNTRNGEHFYTSNPVEQGVLRADRSWRDEGVAFRMSSDKGTPVYRLYNPGGKHLFTTSEKERDALIKARWNYEGVAFRVPEGASVQVYRLYNPWNGDHLLTTGANERGVLVMHKWHDEGVAFSAK